MDDSRIKIPTRQRNDDLINFDLLYEVELTPTGYAQMQPADAPFGVHEMISFHETPTCTDPEGKGVHFFIDDYKFERIWRQPHRYLSLLSKFDLVCAPDFSMFYDYPVPLQQWNHYRNQLIGAWLQRRGLDVLPTAGWVDEASFSWCFDGLPEYSAIAIGTVGCSKNQEGTKGLLIGTRELIRRKHPHTLVIYGSMPAALAELCIETGVDWQLFANTQAERGRRKARLTAPQNGE